MYFSLPHLLLFIPSISAISPIVLGTWQKSTIFCSVSVKFDLCSLVQSCRVLCRQQFIKPNREVHEIGDNFNFWIWKALLATALHDERFRVPRIPWCHGDRIHWLWWGWWAWSLCCRLQVALRLTFPRRSFNKQLRRCRQPHLGQQIPQLNQIPLLNLNRKRTLHQ